MLITFQEEVMCVISEKKNSLGWKSNKSVVAIVTIIIKLICLSGNYFLKYYFVAIVENIMEAVVQLITIAWFLLVHLQFTTPRAYHNQD